MAKKIGAIVSLSIIGILIITTIILANVKVDYSINCARPTYIYVSYNTNDPSKERDAQGHADKIIDYINNASNDKVLTAMFNGNLNKEAKVVAETNAGKNLPTNSGYYVRYRYENKQKLMVDNKEYKDSNGNVVYYEDLVFTVSNVEGESLVKVYVIPDAMNAKVYTHYYELDADFSGLFNYLEENFKVA